MNGQGYGSAPFSIHPVDYQGRERPLLKNSRTAEMSMQRKILRRLKMPALGKADNFGLHKFGGLLSIAVIHQAK